MTRSEPPAASSMEAYCPNCLREVALAAPRCDHCQADFSGPGGWKAVPRAAAPAAGAAAVPTADASAFRAVRAIIGLFLGLAFLGFIWSGPRGGSDKQIALVIALVLGAALVAILRLRYWWAWLLLFAPFAFVGGCTALFAAHFQWGG